MQDKITFELGATLPTRQYENLQPKVTVVADTFNEARDEALRQIQSVARMVGSPLPIQFDQPMNETPSTYEKQVCEISGVEVPFDKVAHKYAPGWTGGSTFANRYKKPFNREPIGTAFAAKHGVDARDIFAMWDLNAEASTALGTAIHAGLELYGKYYNLSIKTKGTAESALHKNPIISQVVTSFYKGRSEEEAGYEVFVANAEKKFCGFIDRLLFVDKNKKIVRVQDYKTNPDINKKATILAPFKGVVEDTSLGSYWLQLSFYAFILQQAGYTVEGLDIFNLENGEWVTYQHDVVDISVTF